MSIIPSKRDLAFPENLTQARYELHKALDRGGEAEKAAWTRDWGEAALIHAESISPDWDDCGPSERIIDAAERASELAASIHAALHSSTPDINSAKAYLSTLRTKLAFLNTSFEALEE